MKQMMAFTRTAGPALYVVIQVLFQYQAQRVPVNSHLQALCRPAKDLMKQLVDRSQIVKRASNAVISHSIFCYHQEWRRFANFQAIAQVSERGAVVLMKALVISS